MRATFRVLILLMAMFPYHRAAENGFVTVRPDATYGASAATCTNGYIRAQKFTMPGTGSFNISEIGFSGTNSAADKTSNVHVAIFTDDAVNGCPEDLVSSSDSGELTVTETGSYSVKYATLSPVAAVTGGQVYWMADIVSTDGTLNISANSTGGTAIYKTGASYPTWPTATGWETKSASTRDMSFYAVYSAAEAGGSPRRLMLLGVGK